MTTFARIRNATGAVEDFRQEADDWSAPSPKFGPDAEFRFVTVVDLPLPDHDAATQMVVPAEPVLTATELRRGWNVVAKPVPESVTPRQIRRALSDAGLRAAVETAIAAADQATRDDWEFALEIRRDWPALAAMATQMNLTDAQVDALFVQAATY